MFDAAFRVVFGAEPAEISALLLLAYCNAGGGFLKLVEVEGAAQEQRLVDGAQSVADADRRASSATRCVSARRYAASNGRDGGATVHTDRDTHRARRASSWPLPPSLVRTIRFEPRLTGRRTSCCNAADGRDDQVRWRSTSGRSGATPGSPAKW